MIYRVRWARPKGEFTKYILKVVCPSERKHSQEADNVDGRISKLPSYHPHREYLGTPSSRNNRLSQTSFSQKKREREPGEVWLAVEETEYVWANLRAGENYQLQLSTMTGSQTCLTEKMLKHDILTKPLPLPADAISVTAYSDRLHINIGQFSNLLTIVVSSVY